MTFEKGRCTAQGEVQSKPRRCVITDTTEPAIAVLPPAPSIQPVRVSVRPSTALGFVAFKDAAAGLSPMALVAVAGTGRVRAHEKSASAAAKSEASSKILIARDAIGLEYR